MKKVVIGEKKKTVNLGDVSKDKTYIVNHLGKLGVITNDHPNLNKENYYIQFPNNSYERFNPYAGLKDFIDYLIRLGYSVFELDEKEF